LALTLPLQFHAVEQKFLAQFVFGKFMVERVRLGRD
jgi:hypothetical protein